MIRVKLIISGHTSLKINASAWKDQFSDFLSRILPAPTQFNDVGSCKSVHSEWSKLSWIIAICLSWENADSLCRRWDLSLKFLINEHSFPRRRNTSRRLLAFSLGLLRMLPEFWCLPFATQLIYMGKVYLQGIWTEKIRFYKGPVSLFQTLWSTTGHWATLGSLP